MRIAFQIERKNYYRLFGPIVDRALHEGWEVECWHDYKQPRTGQKGYEFPELNAVPRFIGGKPDYKIYHGAEQLDSLLAQGSVDAFISLNSFPDRLDSSASSRIPAWITIQHIVDTFIKFGSKVVSSQMCCLYSEYWLQWAIEYFRNKNYSFPSDQTEKMLMNKSRCVGFPELDQCRLIDPEEVRKRWGIPKDQPVVVLLPFPTWTAPYSFWSHYIYSQSSTYLQLYHILRTARIKYVKHVLKGWNDFAVVRAVKEFCKRNGAFLLVKSRLKDPIPPYMEAVADKCIYDERHYPATILETLSIAHLCINFYSTAFTEVIGIGIPNLCIEYSAEDTDYDPLLYTMMINHQEGGFYQYRGVSTCMSIPEVIETLPGKSLSDFKMDSHERKAYVEKFLGYDDGQSSKRVLDEIQALVAKGKSQT